MKHTCILLLLLWLNLLQGKAQNTAPSPALSDINIPIVIKMRPLLLMAERKVDTLFTSPGYPNQWVQADCATRYKYRFRRSPLQMSGSGNKMQLAFTGYYQIIGATRGCTGTTPLTPWTPECSCGFKEAARRVAVRFNGSFILTRDHRLVTTLAAEPPKAMDKCQVCFWGQDVTRSVMDGLKQELDAAVRALKDSFGVVNLRPWMQQAWQLLHTTYAIPSAGYFNLNPRQIRMEQLQVSGDELNLRIGISALPAVSFAPPTQAAPPLPLLSAPTNSEGFRISLDAALQYDSLSRVLNGYLVGKRFEVSEGLIKKHVVVAQCSVQADSSGNLLIAVQFGGSFNGTVHFKGRPVYDAATQSILVNDLSYDLRSKSILLNTAKWLFSNRIVSELNKRTVFPLATYYDTAKTALNTWLNKEWTKGIKGEGSISDLQLQSVSALPAHLLVRSQCNGKLVVRVSELHL